MDITNARSMELFRRLGLVESLRAVAVPKANNFDVSWVTSLTGHELHRFRYPSVNEWRRLIRENNDGSMPGEAPMRGFLVHFRSTAHHVLQHFGVAWHYQSPKGTLIAQNDSNIWTFQAR